ncbi:coiled-coil domain-containing protein 13-like [Trichogramma pretiosum]|uniref:coiled-coil domain-containing protein 13-like n=1 Tax=Trichogramma pretiosum TaxID=7493 RepID=UPI0006C9776A|nr:coiled-coil domain-containing protein 13-like [Trichogramma pretiosum]
MEVIKKSKKPKKRRHRNEDSKNETSLSNYDSTSDDGSQLPEFKIDIQKKRKSRSVETQIGDEGILNFEAQLSTKDEQIKTLTERLHQTKSKLYESKNAYTALKQDFNKAQKLLCSEVGENVSVASLSSQANAGWRGRAEQIRQLQQKVSELQMKLPASELGPKRSLVLRRNSASRLPDREKKQQIENLTHELKEMENALNNAKKKLEISRARVAVLESETNSTKRAMSALSAKSNHDDQLIEALQEELKQVKLKSQERETIAAHQTDKHKREVVLVQSELEASHLHLNSLRRQMEAKERELEQLRCKSGSQSLARSEQALATTCRTSPVESARSSTVVDTNECLAISIAAEAERERLLELVTVLNRRLDREKNDYEQLNESFKREREKSAKLNAKLQKLELERVGLARVNSYRSKAPRICSAAPDGSSKDDVDPEEMRLKYELLQEECLTLKTRLATLRKDKSADLLTFRRTLDQTRKIFKDAYRGKVSNGIGCHSALTI